MIKLSPVEDYIFLSGCDGVHQYIIERSGEVWKQPACCEILFLRRNFPETAVFDWTGDIPQADAVWKWRQGYLPVLEISDKNNNLELLVSGEHLLVRKNHLDVRAFPPCDSPAERFEQELVRIQQRWDDFFSRCLQPIVPAHHHQSAWKSCWVQALSAYRSRHPRYGAGHYAYSVHDGFPPTTIAMTDALWQFGLSGMSLDLMDYFLERFILDNGSFDYYGPSLAEYGMILKNLAAYSTAEEGRDFLHKHKQTILSLTRLLYRQRNPLINGGEKNRLLRGVPEADTRDVEDVYLHNNAWVWRGLKEIARAAETLQWREMAVEADIEAEDLQQCIRRGISQFIARGEIVPYVLKADFSLRDFTAGRDDSYANYRYYPELLESGFLTRDEALKIIETREQCKGEFCGMTLFHYKAAFPEGSPEADAVPEFGCNHWPIYSYGQALAVLGEKDRLCKLIECHYFNYQSRDTFTAYEGIDADSVVRRAITDWCVPAQLVYPRLLLAGSRI